LPGSERRSFEASSAGLINQCAGSGWRRMNASVAFGSAVGYFPGDDDEHSLQKPVDDPQRRKRPAFADEN